MKKEILKEIYTKIVSNFYDTPHITFDEFVFLFDTAKDSNQCIVEIGSYIGLSTVALAYGSMQGNQVPVYAIEPHEKFKGLYGGEFSCEDRGKFFQVMLDTKAYKVVRLINLSSEIITTHWIPKADFLWIDGDHRYESVKRDFNCWKSHLVDKALIAFHDSTDVDGDVYRFLSELNCKKVWNVDSITVVRKE